MQQGEIVRVAVPSLADGHWDAPVTLPVNLPMLKRGTAKASPNLLQGFGAALEQRRLVTLLPFAVIAGLIASVAGNASPDPMLLAGGGLALSLAMLLAWRTIGMLRLVSLALAFWSGFSLLSIHGALFGTPMLSRPAYGTYQARVDEIISEGEGISRVIVSTLVPEAQAKPLAIRRARLFIRNGPPLAPGDLIRAPLRLYQVPGPVLPGSFDAQFHGYFDGIGAYGNSIGAIEILSGPGNTGLDGIIYGVRKQIAARIDLAIAEPAAGIARAIINGDQSAVGDEVRAVMATAGIAHVLSVSGLHLTMVAGGVFAVLRALLAAMDSIGQRLSVKRLAAAGGIMAALGYYAISGGNVAALRSTIMIILVFGAVIFGRQALTMRNVAIAALLVIASDPPSIFRASFQLSFAAVVALVGAFELARERAPRDRGRVRKFFDYVIGMAATSLVAGTATLLFSAYHFQQTSPLGVIGNLLSLPLVGFVMMPAALLAVLAMPFGLDWAPLQIMGWSVDAMIAMARLVSGWSEHLRASPLLTPLSLVIGLIALGWFAFLPNRYRVIGPLLAIPAVLLFGLDRPPDVLVADTTRAIAFRTDAGLDLLDGKPGSFAVEIWSQTYGQPVAQGLAPAVRCDSIGCLGQGKGFTVAATADPSGFPDDCASADLVIARIPAPAYCRAQTQVIDANDLALHGAYWLAWDAMAARFTLRPAIDDLNRPWRAGPH